MVRRGNRGWHRVAVTAPDTIGNGLSFDMGGVRSNGALVGCSLIAQSQRWGAGLVVDAAMAGRASDSTAVVARRAKRGIADGELDLTVDVQSFSDDLLAGVDHCGMAVGALQSALDNVEFMFPCQ